MRVPFFDATRAAAIDEPLLAEAFSRVLRSGRYILGPEVEAFEARAAAEIGVAATVGVSSGTDALLVTLAALGIDGGAEVIVPAYGFVATAEVVARLGARPVFADVLPDDLNVDPAHVAGLIGPKTRAIVAVHLFGAPADVPRLADLGVPLIEDAAQAFGASLAGARIGSLGRAGCFSFFPTKNLGGLGDGGLVASKDAELLGRVRALRSHGQASRDVFTEIGGNFRLDALQAALLGARLPKLEAAIARRREIAGRYVAGLARGVLRPIAAGEGATFNQFVVRVTAGVDRDGLRARLADRGIATQVYYPHALPDQPCFARFDPVGDFPVARAAAASTLALPCYPELRDDEIDEVLEALAACGS